MNGYFGSSDIAFILPLKSFQQMNGIRPCFLFVFGAIFVFGYISVYKTLIGHVNFSSMRFSLQIFLNSHGELNTESYSQWYGLLYTQTVYIILYTVNVSSVFISESILFWYFNQLSIKKAEQLNNEGKKWQQ